MRARPRARIGVGRAPDIYKRATRHQASVGSGVRRVLEEVSELIGVQVYTNKGVFLGNVNNLIVDIDGCRVDGLFITDTNPLLVEDSRNIAVPFRWVQSVGDIILLRFFPKRVTVKRAPSAAKVTEAAEGEAS
jgi:sporulation protein YlmC with PRC-barrel domain